MTNPTQPSQQVPSIPTAVDFQIWKERNAKYIEPKDFWQWLEQAFNDGKSVTAPVPPVVQAPGKGYKLTRSIIYKCPALVLPQSFIEKLGMTAQIVPLKGFTDEQAQKLCDDCNAAPAAIDVRDALKWTSGVLQELVKGKWRDAKEQDRVRIGNTVKTISEVLDMADAALSPPQTGKEAQK